MWNKQITPWPLEAYAIRVLFLQKMFLRIASHIELVLGASPVHILPTHESRSVPRIIWSVTFQPPIVSGASNITRR